MMVMGAIIGFIAVHASGSDRPLRIGVLTTSPVNRSPSASVAEAVDNTASLLEDLGHHVTHIDKSDQAITTAFADDFVLYWAFLAGALSLGGKKLIKIKLQH